MVATDEHQERVAQRPLRRRTSTPAPASGAETAAPTTPASEIRALALTSVIPSGSSRGTAAAFVTPYALEATRHAERGREQHVRLVDHRVGEHPAQERPERHRGADRPPAAVAEPVEERPDQRRHDRERQHRHAEEQRHLAAGLVGRHLEEQRAGQRDRDRRVAGGVERVQLDQPGQPASRRLPRRGRPAGPEAVRARRRGPCREPSRGLHARRRGPRASRRRPGLAGRRLPTRGAPRTSPAHRERGASAVLGWLVGHAAILPGAVQPRAAGPPDEVGNSGPGDNAGGGWDTIAHVITAARTKPDSVRCAAVDARARGASLERCGAADVGDHLGQPVRGRARRHPLLRVHAARATAAGAGRSPSPGRRARSRSPSTRWCCSPATTRSSRPTWVPYRERIQPGDLSPGDLLPDRGRRPAARAGLLLGDARRALDDKAHDRAQRRRRARPGPGPGALARGSRPGRRALVRRRPRPGARRSPRRRRRAARPAGSWCGSPARCGRCSACAPTATPTTTAAWSRSTTAAARTPRRS